LQTIDLERGKCLDIQPEMLWSWRYVKDKDGKFQYDVLGRKLLKKVPYRKGILYHGYYNILTIPLPSSVTV